MGALIQLRTEAMGGTGNDPHNLQVTSDHEELSIYSENVFAHWDQLMGRVKSAFGKLLADADLTENESLSFYTTGSDGRGENKIFDGKTSNLELMAVWDSLELQWRFKDSMLHLHDRATLIIANAEWKFLDSWTLSMFEGNEQLPFPTRIWDALYLWGNEQVMSEMKRQTSNEIAANKKAFDRFQKRFRNHRRILETGSSTFHGEHIQEFDLNAGVLYFDPENHAFSVKPGPLRTIQYGLAVGLMKKIRATGAHLPFIDVLPANIAKRLDFIADNKLSDISAGELARLKYVYTYFLKIYHQLQYENLTLGKTAFSVDRDTLTDIKDMLRFLAMTLGEDKRNIFTLEETK